MIQHRRRILGSYRLGRICPLLCSDGQELLEVSLDVLNTLLELAVFVHDFQIRIFARLLLSGGGDSIIYEGKSVLFGSERAGDKIASHV